MTGFESDRSKRSIADNHFKSQRHQYDDSDEEEDSDDDVGLAEKSLVAGLRSALNNFRLRNFDNIDLFMRNLRPNEKQAAIEMLGSSESSHSDGSSYTDASVSTCLPFNRLLRLLLNDERTRHKAAEKACRLLVRSKLTSRECNECIDELRYAARLPWDWKSRNAMLDNLLTLVSEWFDSAPKRAPTRTTSTSTSPTLCLVHSTWFLLFSTRCRCGGMIPTQKSLKTWQCRGSHHCRASGGHSPTNSMPL